ncbi:MAG: hypothetical protein Q8O91_10625 [Candidatus Aminicenantes bacterium]|nr:hypothetical protein [Candidatus Aminicenantes bacterium]
MRKFLRISLLAVFALVLAGPFFPQAPNPEANLVKDLKWRNIGPANMTGRISAFDALDKDFTQVLVGGASGGVWKSANAGTTWEPIFEKYGTSSIGDVAFFQKNPNIIWVGTGEECVRNSVEWGDGVYKSVDGGKTFKRMGLETTQTIGTVLPHPTDPDVCYVAAAGHPWGLTGDRGLFKTTDGGKTWQKLAGGLPNDGKTGAMDLVMDPRNANVLYVTFWQRLRQPWRFDSGGPNGGIYKTTDGGKSWTKLTKGLPTGDLGRVGIAISRSNPKVLDACVEHGFQPRATIIEGGVSKDNPDYKDMTKLGTGIYRSEDGGASWKFMNRTNSRPFYYSHVFINPFDDKLVYFLTADLSYSEDGGKTFKQIGGLHPDFHAMWIDPINRNRFYVGQDGGASLTHDHGKSWIFFDNLCFSQFYAVSADMRDPYYVYGGLQDNGTWGGPSMSREGTILTDFWYNVGGGDGFHTQNDPTDWRTLYGESQGGSIQRTNVETRESRSVRPTQNNIINYKAFFPTAPAPAAQAAGQPPAQGAVQPPAQQGQRGQGGGQAQAGQAASPFRFNWSSPILISPHNPRTLYFGGNHLFKSMDRGDHWMIISPDLTTNDANKNKPSGGITTENTGAERHCAIISIAESSLTPGLVWAGTDDGNVQITRNGGVDWTNVRPNVPGVPPNTWVSRVEASHFDEGTCYLTFDGHRSDDFKPYVFKTADYGATWTNITNNLPDGGPVYVIREDLKNKNLLFVGTQFVVFFSTNGGKSWTSLLLNAPTMAFHDLLIHPRDNDLIAATHSRGIWILDDISALQQASETILAGDAALFEANRPATRWLRIARGGYGRGSLFFRGENPPTGALIHYFLKSKPAGPATIEISDITGVNKTVFSIENNESGIHRLVWDLRWDPPAATVQNSITNAKRQLETAGQRAELTAEQKAILQNAVKQMDAAGTNYRKVTEIQRSAMEALGLGGGMGFGGGGGFGGRGGMGGMTAEPGVYLVKMTVGDKTLTGKITVRQDPMLEAN